MAVTCRRNSRARKGPQRPYYSNLSRYRTRMGPITTERSLTIHLPSANHLKSTSIQFVRSSIAQGRGGASLSHSVLAPRPMFESGLRTQTEADCIKSNLASTSQSSNSAQNAFDWKIYGLWTHFKLKRAFQLATRCEQKSLDNRGNACIQVCSVQ